jgi:hypothetical protein
MLHLILASALWSTPAVSPNDDAQALNALLSLEHEQIAITTALAGLPVWGSETSPLAPALLGVAKEDLKHEIAAREALISQINALGAEPVAARDAGEYLRFYPQLPALAGIDGLIEAERILAEREANAVNAYYGVIPLYHDLRLHQTLAGLAAAHAGHYGALNAFTFALGVVHSTESHTTVDTVVAAALPPFKFPQPSPRQGE